MKTHNEIKLLSLVFAGSMAITGMAHANSVITFHNNTDAVVHIDYMTEGCTTDVKPDKDNNLPFHSTVKFSCPTAPADTNIQLAQYSGPVVGSKCYFPDKGYAGCTVSEDIMTFQWLPITVDYAKMQENVQTVVSGFNALRKDSLTLIPNVIPMNEAQLRKGVDEKWSLQFSYDASRYPLFNGAYCLAHPGSATCARSKGILSGLLNTVKAIPDVSKHFTLPSAGVWAYDVGTAKAGTVVQPGAYSPNGSPALDGPIAVAELAVNGNSGFYQNLIGTLSKYSLSGHAPASAKDEREFLSSTSPYFNGSLALLSQAILVGNGDLENARKLPVVKNKAVPFDSKTSFMDNYKAWTSSGFLATFQVTDKNGAKVPGSRVIFSVKNAPHEASDNWLNAGESPTVSEGMAYGLLIAYAANDQARFNEFLNYILFEAYNHGCAGMDASATICTTKSEYLMPWLVDQTGAPIHYTLGGKYLTNGSATDADINIAWALRMAAKASDWLPYNYAGMDYATLAKHMQDEIARYDINKGVKFFGADVGELYGPGSQWGTGGLKVLYPGYDAPQAFEALSK